MTTLNLFDSLERLEMDHEIGSQRMDNNEPSIKFINADH